MKKYFTVMVFVLFFLMGFSYTTKVFSEEEISLKIVKNNYGNDILKVFAPSNMEKIYVEVYHMEKSMLAGIYLDYYSLEDYHGRKKNTFVFQPSFIKDKNQITFKFFPGTEREQTFMLSDLEVMNLDSPLEESTNDPIKIRAMTFNIHHGKSKLGLYNLDQIASLIKEKQVDIVGLQEVDKNVYRSKFNNQVKLLASELGMYYAFGSNMRFMGMEYGNAILSKYPIESMVNVQLPGFKEKRGLLMSQIQINNQRIHYLVTHLGLTKQERRNQANIIKKYVKFLGEKVILVGDFNSHEDSDEMNALKEVMTDSATLGEGRYQHTYDGLVIKSRIDYILISPDIKVQNYEVIDTDLSDHFPLMADLEL